jgi:hypothetical protein
MGLPGLDAGPVDHAWLDNGHGILSCVAGHRHASDAVAVCPFYLRADVVDTICSWTSTSASDSPGARVTCRPKVSESVVSEG